MGQSAHLDMRPHPKGRNHTGALHLFLVDIIKNVQRMR